MKKNVAGFITHTLDTHLWVTPLWMVKPTCVWVCVCVLSGAWPVIVGWRLPPPSGAVKRKIKRWGAEEEELTGASISRCVAAVTRGEWRLDSRGGLSRVTFPSFSLRKVPDVWNPEPEWVERSSRGGGWNRSCRSFSVGQTGSSTLIIRPWSLRLAASARGRSREESDWRSGEVFALESRKNYRNSETVKRNWPEPKQIKLN